MTKLSLAKNNLLTSVSTKPFFSVIIPTLNEAKYLPNLLSDLASQTFRDFEVIVVDGNSKDETVNLAKSFRSQLPALHLLLSHKRHVCTQRNLGAKRAHADIFIFLDSDTRILDSFLQGIKYRWETNHCDILTSWMIPDINNSTNNSLAFAINTFFDLQFRLKPTYLLESFITISRDCFRAVAGFDETVKYAEGKTLIQAANKLGFHSILVHDPVYTFSFRRLRKYGIFNMLSRIARIELTEIAGLDKSHTKLKQLYPMQGGSFFDQPNRLQFLRTLENLSQSPLARERFLKKIQKIIDRLFS